ncbi:MAG: CHASE3 domain-containing protein, partial [Nevskiaceae bacterium]
MTSGGRSGLAHGAFWLAIVAVLGMGYAQYRWTFQAIDSVLQLRRSAEILEATRAVDVELARAESALRGFLLAGDGGFLAEQRRAMAALRRAAGRVATLVADDPEQAARTHGLERRIAQRLARMEEALRLH